jgi:hypothetical protein
MFTMVVLFAGLISFGLFFIDFFGGLNLFFAISPLKSSMLTGILGYFAEFLKISQFLLANYFACRYSHKLQCDLQTLRAINAPSISLAHPHSWLAYAHKSLTIPLPYVALILFDLYLLCKRVVVTEGVCWWVLVAQLSWVLAEGYVHWSSVLPEVAVMGEQQRGRGARKSGLIKEQKLSRSMMSVASTDMNERTALYEEQRIKGRHRAAFAVSFILNVALFGTLVR